MLGENIRQGEVERDGAFELHTHAKETLTSTHMSLPLCYNFGESYVAADPVPPNKISTNMSQTLQRVNPYWV